MSLDGYQYRDERPWVFTEEGSVALIQARDQALHLLGTAGAFRAGMALRGVSTGTNWQGWALIDRLAEMGDIVRLSPESTFEGDRIYIAPRRDR